jgi:hypothetical protein
MSNLSELLPSGGGQNVVEFTASGAVASGKPVILNSDGTVTEVAEEAAGVGSEAVFANATCNYTAVAYDSDNDKIVAVYSDASSAQWLKAVVGTVSGKTITWGTPVVAKSVTAIDVAVTAGNGKVLIGYSDGSNSYYATMIVGTISGTSISFGTATVIDSSGQFFNPRITYFSPYPTNPTYAHRYVAAWSQNGGRAVATVIEISGTSITTSGQSELNGANNAAYLGLTWLGANNPLKLAAIYRNVSSSGNGWYNVITYSAGNPGTLSIGSAAFFATNAQRCSLVYDQSADKVVAAYVAINSSNNVTLIVGTVSGTSISWGTYVNISSNVSYVDLVYDVAAQKSVLAYRDLPGVGKVQAVSVSGTVPTPETAYTFNAGDPAYIRLAYNSSEENNTIVYKDIDNSNYGTGIIFADTSTNLTATNFIGLASAAISDTATGDINVKGGINEVASPALAAGSETNLTGKTQSPYPVITYDITNSKFVVFFQDGNNSNYGTSVVVTVSGTTVTFGTPVVFNSGSTNYIDATYSESNGKHLVVYPDYGNSQQATAIVGTVSGTSISFGSEQVYDTGTANTRVSVAYNSNLDKYLAGSTPSSGTINVTVLTVSGTTVSAGTPVSLSGTKYLPNIASNESASDFVLGNNKNDNQSEAHLISVSGTVPTVETSTDLSAVVSTSYPKTGLAFLESNKFVCVYSDNSTNSMYTRTITVSGTSLSLGTASSAFTVDPNAQTNINGAWPLFKATTTSAYLYYQDDTSNYLKYVPISISGTTATNGTEVTYTSQTSDYEGFFYSADAKQGLSFFQSTNSGQQTAAIAQSGVFAIGSDYYVQSDGTISTTSTSPAVKIGQAITATTINMMDLT